MKSPDVVNQLATVQKTKELNSSGIYELLGFDSIKFKKDYRNIFFEVYCEYLGMNKYPPLTNNYKANTSAIEKSKYVLDNKVDIKPRNNNNGISRQRKLGVRRVE